MRVAVITQLKTVIRLHRQLPTHKALSKMGTLLNAVSSIRSLRAAWKSVSRGSSKHSYGPDGVALNEFGRNAEHHLREIESTLRFGAYHFQGYRGCALKKKPSANVNDLKSWRPISVPSIRDRVVQRAILDAIWSSVRKHVVNLESFGGIRKYRMRRSPKRLAGVKRAITQDRNHDKRNVQAAATRVVELREAGNNWVFETDIENFYPSIDRQRLLEMLGKLLRDHSLDDMIVDAVATSVTNESELGEFAQLWNPDLGVPQGGILSPILANLYLSKFDVTMRRSGFKMVRYVDDLVVMCSQESEAVRAYNTAQAELSELGLNIHPLGEDSNGRVKTSIRAPGEPFDFLGLTFSKHSIKPTRKKITSMLEKIRSITDTTSDLSFVEILQNVNLRLDGWIRSYNFCNLTPGELNQIDDQVRGYLLRWMRRRKLIKHKREVDPDAYQYLGVRPLSKFQGSKPILQSVASIN